MKKWFATPESCSGPGPMVRKASNSKPQASNKLQIPDTRVVLAVVLLLAGIADKSFAQCCPPNILTQPQSTTNNQGTTATFWVVVSSSTTVTYQWKFNGANVVGA